MKLAVTLIKDHLSRPLIQKPVLQRLVLEAAVVSMHVRQGEI
jgi:hypothetical protein